MHVHPDVHSHQGLLCSSSLLSLSVERTALSPLYSAPIARLAKTTTAPMTASSNPRVSGRQQP